MSTTLTPTNTKSQNSDAGFFSIIAKEVSNIAEGAVYGEFSDNQSISKSAGQIGVGLIPGVGQVADARDTIASTKKVINGEEGGWSSLAMSIIGWVPLFGDGLKAGAGSLARKVSGGSSLLAKGAKSVLNLGSAVGNGILGAVKSGAKKVKEMLPNNMFSKPKTTFSKELPAGYGETDKYGNMIVSSRGSKTEQALVYNHEKVHSFLSPKFAALKEFRADARMSAYQNSSLVRYLEEALAESYAQVKVNGLKGLPEGLSFPIKNGYVELKDVVKESAIGSVLVGGATYGVYLKLTEE